MYVQQPVIEGFWDNIKAAYQRARKIKPIKVLAREVGVDTSRDPQASLSYGKPASIAGIELSGTNLAIAAGVLWFLTRKKGRR